MFEIKKKIARNVSTDLDDTASVKFALTALGYHDDTETGLSPYADDDFFESIKGFQKDNELEVDGVLNPDGETQRKIGKKLKDDSRSGNAFGDFWRNFNDMKKTDFIGGDKYFHCKANYEAAERGWDGKFVAKSLSDAKEFKDQFKYSKEDVDTDQEANRRGRTAAKSGIYSSARDACAIYRPKGLDEKY